jgi:ABC-type lipoprotein export system ATPase subunit
MRLTKIQVCKLFGVFDHTIPLNLVDRITIIHGPNGFGKTAMLQMVQSLLGNRFSRLRRVPFESFIINFEDGREISVTKKFPPKAEAEREESAAALFFQLKIPGHKTEDFTLPYSPSKDMVRFPLELIDQHIEDLERVGPDTWVHLQTGRKLQLEDIVELYGELLPVGQQKKIKIPDWLTNLPSEFDVRLIEAQRLLNVADNRRSRRSGAYRYEPAVSSYSKELAANVQEIQAKYGTYSQQLDSSFPMRVFQAQPASAIDTTELTRRLQELEQRRQQIIAAGLLAPEENSAPIFGPQKTEDETKKSILFLFAEDIEKKLDVFHDITAKIELFKELVNKRFAYKQLDIERQAGFRFRTSVGLQLLPTDLSSGEQHELVLLYELLFKTKQNALILIDEPELSLHVAWQVEYLKDLSRIVKLSSFDVILATHSPQIINDRWDLAVGLKGPEV